MNKKNKVLLMANIAMWAISFISIILGILFIIFYSKSTDGTELHKIGINGSKIVGGTLIASSAAILIISIVFFTLKVHKESNKIIVFSFVTSIMFSLVMFVMAILDLAKVWEAYPWIINFVCLINMNIVLIAFRSISRAKLRAKEEAILNKGNHEETTTANPVIDSTKMLEELFKRKVLSKEESTVIYKRIKFLEAEAKKEDEELKQEVKHEQPVEEDTIEVKE